MPWDGPVVLQLGRSQLGHGVLALSHYCSTHGTLVAAAAGVLEFYLENFVLKLLRVMNPGSWVDGCQPGLGQEGAEEMLRWAKLFHTCWL